jgi:hypothetical protein
MKLSSLQLLFTSFISVSKRFPFVLLAALNITVISILLIEKHLCSNAELILGKVLMTSSLGLPLFFALHIFCERTLAKPMFKFMAFVTALFVLVQFYFSLANWDNNNGPIFYRFFFWSAGLHLVAAFSAFFIEDELNGFWQFNKQLFLRFLTAALYSGVLYLGLAGAILAVDELFNVNVRGEVYAELWFVVAGLFNTIFFLGGITEPVASLNQETSYPKGLKVFTQYVLIPLVTIYLLILYAYTAKILIQMSLPKGWVANLILGFSVTGILSLLLVYPIREEEENRWIKTFSRFYYFSLVPLIVLLFIAIGVRISAYGVTVERYMVAMLGVWLAFITLYFIFSKAKNIILIPLTLAVFLFGSCFGPWGMFKVSERSQLKRLHTLLDKNGALIGGKIIALTESDIKKIKIKDLNQMNYILDYLSSNHGFEGMKDWLSEDCSQIVFTDSLNKNRYDQQITLKKCIGVYGYSDYRNQGDEAEMQMNIFCNHLNASEGIPVSGYDIIYEFNINDYNNGEKVSDKGSTTRLNKNQLTFYIDGEKQFDLKLDSIAAKLRALPSQKYNTNNADPKDMIFEFDNLQGQKVKMLLNSVQSGFIDSTATINTMSGYLLLMNE